MKKAVKKKRTKRKTKTHSTIHQEIKIERALTDNFIALQKVMTNLSLKFDNLSDQLSKLLNLFEISAKSLAEKDFNTIKGDRDNKQIVNKLDNLLDQNKIIAKGLTLMHETNMGIEPETNIPMPQKENQPQMQRQLSPPTPQLEPGKSSLDLGQYQRSISAKPQNINKLPRI